MKIQLTEDMVNEILSEKILQDIRLLRSDIWDLQKQVAYNPEYQDPNHYIHEDLNENVKYLNALLAVKEYYGLNDTETEDWATW